MPLAFFFFVLTKTPSNIYIFHECRRWRRDKGGERTGNFGVCKEKLGQRISTREKRKCLSANQIKVKVLTIAGKNMYSSSDKAENGNLNISTAGFPKGAYIIKITAGSALNVSGKFVLAN